MRKHLGFPRRKEEKQSMQQGKPPLYFIDRINEWCGKLVGSWVLLMMGITVFEVVARYVFDRPTFWAHETVTMVYAGYIILAAGYTIRHKASPAHIKMDIFYQRYSPRQRAIVDLIASLTFFLFVGMLMWMGFAMAWRSTMDWEHSLSAWAPLLWPVKWCLPVGAFLMLAQGVARFVRDLRTVIQGGRAA